MKLILGLFLLLISVGMLYTFFTFMGWYAQNVNTLLMGILVSMSLLGLAVGIILVCDHVVHNK